MRICPPGRGGEGRSLRGGGRNYDYGRRAAPRRPGSRDGARGIDILFLCSLFLFFDDMTSTPSKRCREEAPVTYPGFASLFPRPPRPLRTCVVVRYMQKAINDTTRPRTCRPGPSGPALQALAKAGTRRGHRLDYLIKFKGTKVFLRFRSSSVAYNRGWVA